MKEADVSFFKRVVRKVKKTWFDITGNDDAFFQLKINQFIEAGGKCGENFKFYCDMPIEPYLIEIGDDVTIAAGTALLTHDNSVIKCDLDATDYFGKIIIGDHCFIGVRCLLLPGVVLGERTIVGAGSVVTKSFPQGNVVIAGNPAKVICSVEEFRKKKRSICVNLDKDNLRARKRDYLTSLPDTMLEKKHS